MYAIQILAEKGKGKQVRRNPLQRLSIDFETKV